MHWRDLSSADDVVEGEYVEQRSEKRSDRTIGSWDGRKWFSLWQESVSAGAEVNDLLPPAGIWDTTCLGNTWTSSSFISLC